MFTSKHAWLAAVAFAISVAGSTVTAFAAVPTGSAVTLQNSTDHTRTTTTEPMFHLERPRYWGIGPDGLMLNGLLPPSPSIG